MYIRTVIIPHQYYAIYRKASTNDSLIYPLMKIYLITQFHRTKTLYETADIITTLSITHREPTNTNAVELGILYGSTPHIVIMWTQTSAGNFSIFWIGAFPKDTYYIN